MAYKLSISVTGMSEFTANATTIVKRINSEEMQDRLMPGAFLVRDIAKRLVNLGRGKGDKHLRDAIYASKGRRARGFIGSLALMSGFTDGPSVIAGVAHKRAPHGHLVEFGHGGRHPAPAHPFLRPALAAARPGIILVIENAVRSMLAPYSR